MILIYIGYYQDSAIYKINKFQLNVDIETQADNMFSRNIPESIVHVICLELDLARNVIITSDIMPGPLPHVSPCENLDCQIR